MLRLRPRVAITLDTHEAPRIEDYPVVQSAHMAVVPVTSLVLRDYTSVRYSMSVADLGPNTPVIDWAQAPAGFPVWIESNDPGDGPAFTGWHREEEHRYVDPAGGYWEKLTASLYRVHRNPAPQEKWSLNGKNGAWNYDSLSELIRDNYSHGRDSASPMGSDDDLVIGRTLYRAIECKDDPARFLPDADDVISHMAGAVCDSDASEWANNYPDVDDAARAELEKALEPLQAWARKHCQPDFFTVKNIAQHTLTEDDVRAAQ
ncbi:hypothetical protein [Pseudomonas sp. MWU12-2323]|uniref:hypothetical protein n=1 Tax=Pseudomonas sp. MWU12-2323 TaxID=2651296 RepID=UPI00128E562C|nr:hypothetical protein [Pseudomonas sp. MWU12-2323]MPQ69484.1 hypothetical protein [Pseudomonas sp. MWU12-2323]